MCFCLGFEAVMSSRHHEETSMSEFDDENSKLRSKRNFGASF